MEGNEQQQDNNQQPDTNQPERITDSQRRWRSCCLAPVLALGLLLILTIGASLFSPGTRIQDFNPLPEKNGGDPAKRQAFVQFGKEFFAIAKKADDPSEEAFKMMETYTDNRETLDNVHKAFREASTANGKASDEFKQLAVPNDLLSQDKLQASLDSISESYDYRRQACDVLAAWNGDTNDRETANEYIDLTQKINELTRSSLQNMMEAADDNGLTMEDIREFAPASSINRGDFGNIIKLWSEKH